MKKSHFGKVAVTLVVTILVILYYVWIFSAFFAAGADMPILLEGIVLIIPVVFIAGMIYVCIKRINEIERGDEDDLDNY